MGIINFIFVTLLFCLILATIVGLIFFVIFAIKLTWKERKKDGLIPVILAVIFFLVIIGGILRTIQLGYNCYKLTGGLMCGGGAPDDNRDFMFPNPQ